jgi:hypothetical protein
MAVFKLVSKSTKVSAGQSAACRSSRATIVPAASSSLRENQEGLVLKP